MSFFNELKRRNVFRMGAAYVVVAWVLLQAIDFALDIISAPNWVMQVFFIAAVAGLPLVLIFSWIFEMTPDGIKLESEIDRSQSVTPQTGRKLDRTIIVFLVLAVALLLADRFIGREHTPLPPSTVTAEVHDAGNSSPANDVQSIAVLPFVNMSSDPEQEYFSDGLSEELLNRLAKNEQLQVAARTSSFQFKGQNQDVGAIGKQLKVDHVLEGSVRKSANRLRVTAQLIQVDSGYHLWSETYEREINDIFAIQDDISLAITNALEAELGTSSAIAGVQATDNLEAYQLYLEARYLLAKRGEANMLKAHDLFGQAVDLDPGFSRAWSGLAYNYALLPSYGAAVSTQMAGETVKMSAGRAIELEPGNAEAYVALARGSFHEPFKIIRGHFEKAFELAPNNADVLNLYADFMVQTGDFPAAERLERKAIELDPLAAVHYSDLAFVLFPTGRYEEGLEHGRTSARLEPDSFDRSDALVVGLILNEFFEEAIPTIRHFEQMPGTDAGIINTWWCQLYFQQGDKQNLREKVNERIEKAGTGLGNFYHSYTAFYLGWLDGVDAALPWLELAYEVNEFPLTWPDYFYLPEDTSDDPAWLAYWQRPRLAELIEIRRHNGPYENIGYKRE
jgi:TolB-like protein